MGIKIIPYSENIIESVIDFNQRLAECGSIFKLPETNIPRWLPKIDDRKIYQENFLAIENDSIVRGGYTLKHQEFSFEGKIISIGVARAPLSEGIINNKYNLVALQLLTDALKKQPLLYGLGLGSEEEPINKIYRTLGWPIIPVPFYFKVNNPSNFLKGISFLRRTWYHKLIFDILAVSGIGSIVIKLIQYLFRKVEKNENLLSIEIVEDFSYWADRLWENCKEKFTMIGVRDSNVLNILYPKDDDRFIRLKVSFKDAAIGWVVILNTQMSNHKQFGDMRVGSIIDCLALPHNASKVLSSATKYLEKADVDLIISNQTHHSWCSALKNSGFINGLSNFNFTASKELIKLLNHPKEIMISNMHLNRGDCDGPNNL